MEVQKAEEKAIALRRKIKCEQKKKRKRGRDGTGLVLAVTGPA